MIQAMQPYSHYAFIAVVTESVPGLLSLKDTLANRIGLTGLIIIAQVGILFLYNHQIFCIGLVGGFIFHQRVKVIAKDVNDVYSSYKTWIERIFLHVVGGLFAIYTWPITFPIAAISCSALCSAQFREYSLNRYPHSSRETPLEEMTIEIPVNVG